jgi:mannan endo-1,4-beta-mannosidase
MNRDYIRMIVGRINSVNGRAYAEDPTIMSWQLANEPRPGPDDETGRANLPAFYRWLDETAQYIKSLDTNHLVSSGSEGTVGTLKSEECYRAAYNVPSIDYLNFHVWPLNWGWFDPTRIAETYPSTVENVKAYIAMHLRLARELNKPITMEEFGLGRDQGDFRPGTPTTARDA